MLSFYAAVAAAGAGEASMENGKYPSSFRETTYIYARGIVFGLLIHLLHIYQTVPIVLHK